MLNLNKLVTLPYFTLSSIRSQTASPLLPYLKYHLKKGTIISLKRGVYVTKEYLTRISDQGKLENYREYLAVQLVQPSYISLEYALSAYSLLTEAPYSITLITDKTPRYFNNITGTFRYYNIKEPLFTGYKMIPKKSFTIPYATRAKALFDYLYFKKRGMRQLNGKIIKELRLNLENLTEADWEEFRSYIILSNSNKMKKIEKLLKQHDP